ncbi:MAG: hypothetical protein FJZ01_14480 [Candidatus Sericytochromatia bacterium]|nr:hypothetical protein [Candidatus Tanganyikabacteria bacterium]
MSPLRTAIQLLLRRGGELVAPPGSEAGVALLVALTGMLIGLAMPAQIATIRLLRVLVGDGAGALVSTLQAFPRPTPQLLVVAAGLLVAIVVLAAGWINVALAAARGDTPDETTWRAGLSGAGRIVGWNLVIIGWLGLVGILGGEMGYLAIKSGLSASRSGEVIIPSLMGIAGLALWAFTLGAALSYLAVSCLGAIVAVAEPQTGFWSLFSRAPRLFMAGAGWRGFQELVVLLAAWWTVKAACTQLLVPLWPPAFGVQSATYGIAGALLQAGLALGDGIVLLISVLMGAVIYVEATRELDKAGEGDRHGRLKPWLLLPGRRSSGSPESP